MDLTRDGLRGMGISEENINEILSARGKEMAENVDLKKQLLIANEKANQIDILNSKIKELESKNMTQEEIQEQKIKEAEKAKKDYEILTNKMKATQELSKAGIVSDENVENLIEKISTGDLQSTLDNVKMIVNLYSQTKAKAEQDIKDQLLANNPKPPASNNLDDGKMTKEKFNKLTYKEMEKFAKEHPEEFKNM